MAGYGNRTAPDLDANDLSDQHDDTRLNLSHSNAYSGGHSTFRSGTVGGAGFGNKSAPTPSSDPSSSDTSNAPVEFKYGHDTKPYSGGHSHHGSGSVGGAGWGNKTGGFKEKHDSVVGKVVERVGRGVGSQSVEEKGRGIRVGKGFGREEREEREEKDKA